MYNRFKAVDLYTEGYFLMDLHLDVCLEASQVPSCALSVEVLKNFYLPKKQCAWNAPFKIPGQWQLPLSELMLSLLCMVCKSMKYK